LKCIRVHVRQYNLKNLIRQVYYYLWKRGPRGARGDFGRHRATLVWLDLESYRTEATDAESLSRVGYHH
jgi:hypothetical protein